MPDLAFGIFLSIINNNHLVAGELINGIAQNTVFIGISDILHLRSEVNSLGLFIKLQGNFRIVNGNQVLNDLCTLTAFYGSGIEQMVNVTVFTLLFHKSSHTLCRKVSRQSLIFTKQFIQNTNNRFASDQRALNCILGKDVERNICAVFANGNCRRRYGNIVRSLRMAGDTTMKGTGLRE